MRTPKRIQCQSDKLNFIGKDGKSTYISMAEAKSILNLTSNGIKRYIIRRQIKAFKSAGKWWLNRSDVEAFKALQKYR